MRPFIEIEQIRKDNKEFFDFADKIDALAHHILDRIFSIPIDGNEFIKEIIIRTCLLRSFNDYYCIITLLERGMTSQTGILLRSLIELKNVISASILREEFVKKYLKANELNEIKNNSSSLKSNLAGKILGRDTEKRLEELGQELNNRKDDCLSVEKIANFAQFSDEYKLVYSELCMYVHPSIDGLVKDHVTFDTDDGIKSFLYFPNHDNFNFLFRYTIAGFLHILDAVNIQYSLEFNKNISSLNQEFNTKFVPSTSISDS